MIFEDWNESFPVIHKDNVADPSEITPEFFKIPKEKRGNRLNYTD